MVYNKTKQSLDKMLTSGLCFVLLFMKLSSGNNYDESVKTQNVRKTPELTVMNLLKLSRKSYTRIVNKTTELTVMNLVKL